MPKHPPQNDKGAVNLMMPHPLIEKLNEAAAATRRTKSAYLEIALEAQLQKDGFLPPAKKESKSIK
jgi:hypothetical protein